MLTQAYLKECMTYDPDTGVFTWLVRPVEHFKLRRTAMMWNTRYSNTIIGSKDGKGYFHVSLGGKFYRLHQLAVLYMTGEWPVGEVDHKDHVRTNNKWDNLRQVDAGTNRKNQRLSSRSTCGVTGVYYSRRSELWCAQIKVKGKCIPLGSSHTKAGAVALREAANKKYNFHPNHGVPLAQEIANA